MFIHMLTRKLTSLINKLPDWKERLSNPPPPNSMTKLTLNEITIKMCCRISF